MSAEHLGVISIKTGYAHIADKHILLLMLVWLSGELGIDLNPIKTIRAGTLTVNMTTEIQIIQQ